MMCKHHNTDSLGMTSPLSSVGTPHLVISSMLPSQVETTSYVIVRYEVTVA